MLLFSLWMVEFGDSGVLFCLIFKDLNFLLLWNKHLVQVICATKINKMFFVKTF